MDKLVELYAKADAFRRSEEGQGLVEYGLIIALVAVLLVAALVLMRGGLESIFTTITDVLNNPGAAS